MNVRKNIKLILSVHLNGGVPSNFGFSNYKSRYEDKCKDEELQMLSTSSNFEPGIVYKAEFDPDGFWFDPLHNLPVECWDGEVWRYTSKTDAIGYALSTGKGATKSYIIVHEDGYLANILQAYVYKFDQQKWSFNEKLLNPETIEEEILKHKTWWTETKCHDIGEEFWKEMRNRIVEPNINEVELSQLAPNLFQYFGANKVIYVMKGEDNTESWVIPENSVWKPVSYERAFFWALANGQDMPKD